MSYTFDFDTGELRKADGTAVFTVDREIDPELFGHLATPLWIGAINSGRGTVDETAKTVTIPEIPKSWTVRDDSARPEIAEAISGVMTLFGWERPRAVAFLKLLRVFVRRLK